MSERYRQALREALIGRKSATLPAAPKDTTPRFKPRPGETVGRPKKQLPDGRWVPDRKKYAEGRFDFEQIGCDEAYAEACFRDLGEGDLDRGRRYFAEILAEQYEEGKAARFEAGRSEPMTQSVYETHADQIRDESRNAAIDSEIANLERQKRPVD